MGSSQKLRVVAKPILDMKGFVGSLFFGLCPIEWWGYLGSMTPMDWKPSNPEGNTWPSLAQKSAAANCQSWARLLREDTWDSTASPPQGDMSGSGPGGTDLSSRLRKEGWALSPQYKLECWRATGSAPTPITLPGTIGRGSPHLSSCYSVCLRGNSLASELVVGSLPISVMRMDSQDPKDLSHNSNNEGLVTGTAWGAPGPRSHIRHYSDWLVPIALIGC